jgi:hypothetical protein
MCVIPLHVAVDQDAIFGIRLPLGHVSSNAPNYIVATIDLIAIAIC